MAREAQTDYFNIEVICTDSSEHRGRAEVRAADVSGLRLPTWAEIENREYQAWTVDRIIVGTAGRSEGECANELLSKLSRLRASHRIPADSPPLRRAGG